MMNGIIVIDKETGFTSHDVVAKMRGICGQRKIGHTGTLDPLATGVLPVCLGSATKLCDMLAERDKEYVAELLLGVETDTQDVTGKRLAQSCVEVTPSQVRDAAASFVGEYWQVPPMYSALKVDGKKLYELARAGKEVERKARLVTIYELELLEYRLPVVKMRVACSKGTYIRTLCADMGAKLGCGGTMQSLRRTRVGGFSLEDACTLGQLQQWKDEGRMGRAGVGQADMIQASPGQASVLHVLRPVDSVFTDCPSLRVQEDACRLLDNGNAIAPEQTVEREQYAPDRWVRMYRPNGSFAGIYAYDTARKWYRPVKMFLEKE
ncbi:MAG: tRNA pseudouridine(55) synthase TruB [Lachnospiraceae bacterium]|nr:tRNA pseudouridine(55) synthase TruB [Lachnospiraceae bacterium]